MAWTVVYYQTRRGESPVEEFLDSLPSKARSKCASYIDMLEGDHRELPRNIAAKVSGDLWELRPEYGGVEYRFFYFTIMEETVVIVHAISKKSQKLREQDITLANSRIAEVRERLKDARLQDAPSLRARADRERP